MKDWRGTRVQMDALKKPCPYCHAPAGELCVSSVFDDHRPLKAFPAHEVRIRESRKEGAEA